MKTIIVHLLLLIIGVGAMACFAATGDITSVEISPSGAEPYGACADITIEGFTTGKTIDFGSGRGNQLDYDDIGSATIVFTVVSEGYNSSGALGTATRTVYATSIVRKPYPDQAQNQEPSATVIRVALSDFIYDDDNTGTGKSGTAPTVTIAAGAIRNDGGGSETSAAVSGMACTNSSGLDYPRVVGNWAWPGYRVVTTAVDLEFAAFHRFATNGKPVACVLFDVTDQSANTASQTVTEMVVSEKLTAANSVAVYAAEISTSTLDQGELLTARARAYPWIGDADSILDTGDGVNTMPTPLYAPQYYRNDKSGAWGAFARCDFSDGVDASGSVYSSRAGAESGNAYKTIAAALTALQSYHNTNFGHNDAGGGTILLEEDTYTLNTANGGTYTEWVTIQPVTGAAKANVIVQPATTNSAFPGKMKLSGVTFSSSNYFRGINTRLLWLHDCAINTTGSLTLWESPASYATANTGAIANGFRTFSTSNTSWSIVRGNDMAPVTAYSWCVLGNDGIGAFDNTTNVPSRDNGVYAYNTLFAHNNTMHIEFNNVTLSHGLAVVGNLLESLSSTQPAMQIAADSSNTASANVMVWHNTVAGQRYNAAYNDNGSTPYPRRNWSQKYNSFRDWNNKDDTFATANSARIGSWPVGYAVGFHGNHYEISTFPGEYGGFDLTTGSPGYTNDKSYSGAGGGTGDYTPTSSSVLLERIPTGQRVIPFDLFGHAIANTGDIGAIQVTDDTSSWFHILIAEE